MNARSYRVTLNLSPFDFPPIMGLGESSISYRSETPRFNNDKVLLSITTVYTLLEMDNNKNHEVLAVQSIYEIPPIEIKSREDVYEFYKDGVQSLNEAYQYLKKNHFPSLSNIVFPNQPIENYQKEIDRVFNLLNSRN